MLLLGSRGVRRFVTGPPPLWRHRGLGDTGACATLETPGSPPLWGEGLRRFGETRAYAALGQGYQSLWGMGLHRLGDTGVSAALGTLGPPLLWEHHGLYAVRQGPPPFGDTGASPLRGKGLLYFGSTGPPPFCGGAFCRLGAWASTLLGPRGFHRSGSRASAA